jgi:hypothetical protein
LGEGICHSRKFRAITVPSSVEILVDRCFSDGGALTTIIFEEPSKLKKIGERAFAGSSIESSTIPASVNEIDGSAFMGYPLKEIDVDPGNRRFRSGRAVGGILWFVEIPFQIRIQLMTAFNALRAIDLRQEAIFKFTNRGHWLRSESTS